MHCCVVTALLFIFIVTPTLQSDDVLGLAYTSGESPPIHRKRTPSENPPTNPSTRMTSTTTPSGVKGHRRTTVCSQYVDISPRQRFICRKQPEVAASAFQGAILATLTCHKEFSKSRWNCSDIHIEENRTPHASPIMTRGYRETAYGQAMLTAGMVIQVSRACMLGKLTNCDCVKRVDHMRGYWKWKGCKRNTDYAIDFVKKFLKSRTRSHDLRSRMEHHNNRLGRMIVSDNLTTRCKCHGVSGSCTMKTCWKSAPTFKTVSQNLAIEYSKANKVSTMNSLKGKLRLVYDNRVLPWSKRQDRSGKRRRKPKLKSLVYYERSPNYCGTFDEFDERTDGVGTSGRTCSISSKGSDNCSSMCCGRGYHTLRITTQKRCDCEFHWCCSVKCKLCLTTEWKRICK